MFGPLLTTAAFAFFLLLSLLLYLRSHLSRLLSQLPISAPSISLPAPLSDFGARLQGYVPLDGLHLQSLSPSAVVARLGGYLPLPSSIARSFGIGSGSGGGGPAVANLDEGSFLTDLESGLSSADFDLSQNLSSGDARAGLDKVGRDRVHAIMREKRCDFDQARLILLHERMRANGIDPLTGLSRDKRFVTFS